MRPRILNSGVGLTLLLGLLAASHPARAETPPPEIEPYSHHSATRLKNGKVLIAGGERGGLGLNGAFLFDAQLATYTLTGSMSTKRVWPPTVLLPDGRVLVAGGEGVVLGGGGLSSAELYDPVSGVWSLTGSMSVGRRAHTLTLLADGRVLVAGGGDWPHTLNSSEIYDPVTGQWSAAGPMTRARKGHTATLLADGKVLVAGGGGEDASTPTTAELFDPVSKTWSATGSLQEISSSHRATLLINGKVLVSGGSPSFGELYDPVSAAWSPTGPVIELLWEATATRLDNGKVLTTGSTMGSNTAQLYDPGLNTWTKTASLKTKRSQGHTATLLEDGQVFVFGGLGRDAMAEAEIYDPQTGEWSHPAPNANLPMPGLDVPLTLAITDVLRGSYPSDVAVAQFNWVLTQVIEPPGMAVMAVSTRTLTTPTPELPLAPLTLDPGLYAISLQAVNAAGAVSPSVQTQATLRLPVLNLDLPAILPANGHVTLTPPPNASWANFEWDFQKQNTVAAASSEGRAAARIGQVHVIIGNRTIHLGEYRLDLGAYQVSVKGVDTYGNPSTTAQASFQLVATDLSAIQVYPSPWKSDLHSGHDLTFGDLPADSTVKIFSLDGRWVKTLTGVSGNTPWNLKNDDGRDVASGLYLYLITSPQGQTKGKFAVVR